MASVEMELAGRAGGELAEEAPMQLCMDDADSHHFEANRSALVTGRLAALQIYFA